MDRWGENAKRLNEIRKLLSGRAVGGTLKVGFDPELPEDKQVLLDVAFFTKDEVLNLGCVYPEVLLDEFWDILNDFPDYSVYRRRPVRGFGIRTIRN